MDEHNNARCPHYQLYVQPLDIETQPNVLAIRRCMLTERLIGLLRQTPDGGLLTQKLTVRIDSEREFAIIGPDLEAVTQTGCTIKRCEDQCTPAYVSHLDHFNGSDPHLEEVTCHETVEATTSKDRSQKLSTQFSPT